MILVRLFLLISINILCASSVFAACDLRKNLTLPQQITFIDTIKTSSGTISLECDSGDGDFYTRVEGTLTSDHYFRTNIANVTVKYTVNDTELTDGYSHSFSAYSGKKTFNFNVEIKQTSINRQYGTLILPNITFFQREHFFDSAHPSVVTEQVHVFPTTLNIVNQPCELQAFSVALGRIYTDALPSTKETFTLDTSGIQCLKPPVSGLLSPLKIIH